jgi:hypothetical protein
MPAITFQRPSDQPTGTRRLLGELRALLENPDLSDFRFVVAFSKVGPLLRLKSHIERWRQAGRSIEAIFGVDQKGTSTEALEFAMEHFSSVHIVHAGNLALSPTFHPGSCGGRAGVGEVEMRSTA